jgi:hypothetical protein
MGSSYPFRIRTRTIFIELSDDRGDNIYQAGATIITFRRRATTWTARNQIMDEVVHPSGLPTLTIPGSWTASRSVRGIGDRGIVGVHHGRASSTISTWLIGIRKYCLSPVDHCWTGLFNHSTVLVTPHR